MEIIPPSRGSWGLLSVKCFGIHCWKALSRFKAPALTKVYHIYKPVNPSHGCKMILPSFILYTDLKKKKKSFKFFHSISLTLCSSCFHAHSSSHPFLICSVRWAQDKRSIIHECDSCENWNFMLHFIKALAFFLWVRIIGNKDKHCKINMNAESNKVNLNQLFSGKPSGQIGKLQELKS